MGEGRNCYGVAKAGVLGMTKALALELAECGALVNVVAPRLIETGTVAEITEEWKAAERADLSLGRFGLHQEVAPTAVLLASSPDGSLHVIRRSVRTPGR